MSLIVDTIDDFLITVLLIFRVKNNVKVYNYFKIIIQKTAKSL